MPSPDQSKALLRDFYKQQRLSMGAELRQHLSQQICHNLRSSAIFRQSHRIFAYFATRGEPDLSDLWQDFSNKIWVFPRCEEPPIKKPHCEKQGEDQNEERNLTWHPIQIDRLETDTTIGKYGLTMPHQELPEIPLATADVLLIPALAMDHQGIRLGYGGGYYDRCLANQAVLTIGITYSQFVCDRLPCDPWDIPLSAICTDRGLKFCQR